jgi:Electron transfer DM13
MSILGDLGGGLLALLYDYRYLAMALGAVVVIGVLLLARRYHWASIARRHPVAGGIAAVTALVVFAPVAWYLVSPIWIRTELVEPPVAAAVSSLPPAASATPEPTMSVDPSTPPDPTSSPVPTATPWAAAAPRSGEFQGTDDFHFGRGTATLIETAPGEWTIRLADFSVRNGPDLYVYLSPSKRDYAAGALEVARLKATDGSFNVRLPDGADPADMRSVLIWCKQFSHLFAWATLEG